MFQVNDYAIATGLRGFTSPNLRVRITRLQYDYAWVVTADIQDAGTPLTLDLSQLQPFKVQFVTSHKSGLVALA